ncbi:MAG TPA: chromate transporter [Alphaproteobacteria bacterium]
MDSTEKPRVPLSSVLLIFMRIGITAVGGGTAAWTHRELVEKHRWITDETFTTGMTFSQVLPGANPVNLALYMGLQLRGGIGGTVAVLGFVTPSFCAIILLGLAYNWLSVYPLTSIILGGIAALGVGATLSVGIKLSRHLRAKAVPILIALATFGAIGVMQWPMIPVVAVAVPVSVAYAFWLERKRRHG